MQATLQELQQELREAQATLAATVPGGLMFRLSYVRVQKLRERIGHAEQEIKTLH